MFIFILACGWFLQLLLFFDLARGEKNPLAAVCRIKIMELMPDYKSMLVVVILDQLRDMRVAGMEITKDSIFACLRSYRVDERESLELSESLLKELLDGYEAFKDFMGADLPPWELSIEEWSKLPSYVNSFLMGVYDLSRHADEDRDYGLEVAEVILEEINRMARAGLDITPDSVTLALNSCISRYHGSYRINEIKKMEICFEISASYEAVKGCMNADYSSWEESREDREKLPFHVNSFLSRVYELLKPSSESENSESEDMREKERIGGCSSSGSREGKSKSSGCLETVVGMTMLCLIGFGAAKLEESNRGLAGEVFLYLIGAALAFFSARFLLGDGISGVIDRGGRALRGGLVLVVIIVGLGMLSQCVSEGNGGFCVYKVGCV